MITEIVLTVAYRCDREECGKVHVEKIDQACAVNPDFRMVRPPFFPPGWHRLDDRIFCSADCTFEAVIEGRANFRRERSKGR